MTEAQLEALQKGDVVYWDGFEDDAFNAKGTVTGITDDRIGIVWEHDRYAGLQPPVSSVIFFKTDLHDEDVRVAHISTTPFPEAG